MFEGYVGLVVLLGMLAVKGFAFANAFLWPSTAYAATGKATKAWWLTLLGSGLVADLLLLNWPFGVVGLGISLGFLILSLVYVLDVRPIVSAVTRRR